MAASSRILIAGLATAACAALGSVLAFNLLSTPAGPDSAALQVARGITLTGANPAIDPGAVSLVSGTGDAGFVCMGRATLPSLFYEGIATQASTCDTIQAPPTDASPIWLARYNAIVEACESQGTIVCDDQIVGTGALVNTGDACSLVFPAHLLYTSQTSQSGALTLAPKPIKQCRFVNESIQLDSRYSPAEMRTMSPRDIICEPVRAALGQKTFDIDLNRTVRSGLSYAGRDAWAIQDYMVVEVDDPAACVGLKPVTRDDFQTARENRCRCATISTGSFNGVEFIDYYSQDQSCMATKEIYDPGTDNVGVDHGFTTFKGTSGFMHRTFCPRSDGTFISVPTIMGTAQRDEDGTVRTADGYSSRDEHIIFDDQPNIGILVEGIVFDETE